MEILFCSPAIGNMIREGKTPQITSAIQTGVKEGMIDMDASIRKLYEEGLISVRAALDKAIDKSAFKDLAEGPAPGQAAAAEPSPAPPAAPPTQSSR
jgi:twitching motility protein PilT